MAPGVVATEMSSFVKTSEERDYMLSLQTFGRSPRTDTRENTLRRLFFPFG